MTSAAPECFVIMPLSDHDSYKSGHFTRVFEQIFLPACKEAGFKAINAAQVSETNLIHLDVLERLLNSPMVLCDLSTHNPNVLFELGLRQAFDKPVVLVQEEGTPSIFDIGPLRYTEYRKDLYYEDVLADQKNVTRALNSTKDACDGKNGVNSIVRLLSLTQAASLKEIQEADTDPLLQIIRAEISGLRSEFRDALQYGTKEASLNFSRTIRNEATKLRHSQIAGKQANYIIEYGLGNYLTDVFDIDKVSIRNASKASSNLIEFLSYLINNSIIDATIAEKILSEIKMTRREKELYLKLKSQ